MKADEVSMTTKRGAEVKKQGEEDNPAVKIERSGHDVVKKASELEVEAKGPNHTDGEGSEEDAQDEEEEDTAKDDVDAPAATSAAPEKLAEKKGKAGRPKKSGAEGKKDQGAAGGGKEKQTQKGKRGRKAGATTGQKASAQTKRDAKPKKRAATETGEPRRSKRVKA